MPRKDHTEIVCVVDRSGSMGPVRDDAIGGFNTFLEDQKKLPGTAVLTYVQFNTKVETVYDNKALSFIPKLDEHTYIPGGGTALNDAVGQTVRKIEERLSQTKEEDKPEKVIFCVLTDGQENSSHEFSTEQVKEIVQGKDTQGWEFIFLSADPTVWTQSEAMGFRGVNTVSFARDSEGTQDAYLAMSSMTSSYRTEDKSTANKVNREEEKKD